MALEVKKSFEEYSSRRTFFSKESSPKIRDLIKLSVCFDRFYALHLSRLHLPNRDLFFEKVYDL